MILNSVFAPGGVILIDGQMAIRTRKKFLDVAAQVQSDRGTEAQRSPGGEGARRARTSRSMSTVRNRSGGSAAGRDMRSVVKFDAADESDLAAVVAHDVEAAHAVPVSVEAERAVHPA